MILAPPNPAIPMYQPDRATKPTGFRESRSCSRCGVVLHQCCCALSEPVVSVRPIEGALLARRERRRWGGFWW